MKTRRFEGTEQRLTLIGMILDQIVCTRIANQWTPEGLFDSQWANLIGGWCVTHLRKFSRPPGDKIQRIYEIWANDTRADPKTVEAVESFLLSLSDQSDHSDEPSDYILDVAGTYFNRVRLEKKMEKAQTYLQNGQLSEAEQHLALGRVNLGAGSFIEPARDVDLWLRIRDKARTQPLVRYRGDLGRFIGDSLARNTLYSFLAPDKTGKTTWLMDLAYRAVRQRNRVVFFDVGDSTEEDAMERLAIRSSMKPMNSETLSLPTSWGDNGPLFTNFDLEEVHVVQAYHDFKKICRREDDLRIECHSNSSVSIDDIDGILIDFEKSGWRPDVVIIDYADILADPRGYPDKLQAIDATWQKMRRMSQERHVLLVTATQSNSGAYTIGEGLLGKKNFSGRKTKNAHVNGMLGINVTPTEKDLGMARLNWIDRRKGKSNELDFCRVAGSYALGNPVILSKW